jgi:hypothetical protein
MVTFNYIKFYYFNKCKVTGIMNNVYIEQNTLSHGFCYNRVWLYLFRQYDFSHRQIFISELLFQVVISNYSGRIVWKLSLQDRFFFQITNYQGFWNNQINLYEFFSPWDVSLKYEIVRNFELQSFKLTRFCCSLFNDTLSLTQTI